MEPAGASQSTEDGLDGLDVPLEATSIQELVGAAAEQVQKKKVVLEKLGRFKKVLDVIKPVCKALSNVSANSRSSGIACSSRVPRFIQQLVQQPPLLDSLSR